MAKKKTTKKPSKNVDHASFVLTRFDGGYTVGGLVLDGESVELDLKSNEFSNRHEAQEAMAKWMKSRGYKVESVGIQRG